MKILKFVIFIILFPIILSAQITNNKTNTSNSNARVNQDAYDILNSIQPVSNLSNIKSLPLESAINPEKYFVGPNDQFVLGIYGYINQQLNLTISPEGVLLIPSIGEVDATGLNLSQLKTAVINKVKKRYYSSNVSFTLLLPRTFLVSYIGSNLGTYEANPVMRVSSLIKNVIAFDTINIWSNSPLNKKNESKFFTTTASFRNIELYRKSGEKLNVDLYKFFWTGEDKYNPYLLEGDRIKVPYNYSGTNYITIDGAVQLAGSYEYSISDDLETVIGLAHGFDVNAKQDSIIIYRPIGDNKGFETIGLSYSKDKNFKIKLYDRIFVKFNSNFQKSITVLVLGEVQRPGYYPITFKNTKLRDIIEMAGGFRENAYLPLSIIIRSYDEEYLRKDTAEILLNMRGYDLITSEFDKINFWSDIRSRRNRVIVDFEKLFLKNDETQNIIIEDKDIIYVNDDKKIVYVFGQVNNEGYVQYKDGANFEYYIEKAGGYSLIADKGNTRIIKFNSRGWYKPDEIKINSGDYIYVPKKENRPFSETISLIAQIAGVILGVISTYLLFKK